MFYSGKKIIHVFNQNYEKIQNISLITLFFFLNTIVQEKNQPLRYF